MQLKLKEIDQPIQDLTAIRLKQAIRPLLLSENNTSFRFSADLPPKTYLSIFNAHADFQDFYFECLDKTKPPFEDAVFTCQIDGFALTLPATFHIAVADPEVSDIDVMPVRELIGRSFTPLVYNPVAGARSTFGSLSRPSVGPSALFSWPHVQKGCLVSLPLCHGDNPPCVFVSPLGHKFYDDLDIAMIVG
jgi:hypothetical protein